MKYWLINALCGVLLLVLLGVHMISMHLDDVLAKLVSGDGQALEWASVRRRGQSLFVTVTYVVFLGTALFHGLYGLHTMLTEFCSGRRAARWIFVGCWSLGIFLFVTGTIATLSFFVLARAN